MKKFIYILSLISILSIDSSASDADEFSDVEVETPSQNSSISNPNFGIGFSFVETSPLIKVLLDISDTFRVEPELIINYSNNNDRFNFGIGSGFYILQKFGDNTQVYAGGKVQLGDYTPLNSDVVLSGIAGLEYFIADELSLGGEIGYAVGVGGDFTMGTLSSANLKVYF